MTGTPPPPGWYEAPGTTEGRERWWDGERWGEQVRPSGAPASPAPSPPTTPAPAPPAPAPPAAAPTATVLAGHTPGIPTWAKVAGAFVALVLVGSVIVALQRDAIDRAEDCDALVDAMVAVMVADEVSDAVAERASARAAALDCPRSILDEINRRAVAAGAPPTQRAAAQSDLRNAAIAQETHFTDHGVYSASWSDLIDTGWHLSAGLTGDTIVGGSGYCMTVVMDNGERWSIDDHDFAPFEGDCPVSPDGVPTAASTSGRSEPPTPTSRPSTSATPEPRTPASSNSRTFQAPFLVKDDGTVEHLVFEYVAMGPGETTSVTVRLQNGALYGFVTLPMGFVTGHVVGRSEVVFISQGASGEGMVGISSPPHAYAGSADPGILVYGPLGSRGDDPVRDVDGDGHLDFVLQSNDCNPSCAEGTTAEEVILFDPSQHTWPSG